MSRKCKNLTLDEKIKILKHMESLNAKPNFTTIAHDYGVNRSTISRINKEKETLLKRSEENTQPGTYKRKRSYQNEEVDEALNLWVHQTFKQMYQLNNALLSAKATQLAANFGIEFIPSYSWIERFKARHGICYRNYQGERKHNDDVAEGNYRDTTLKTILAEYSPEDIYSTDETVLYPRCLPDHSGCKKEETLKGSKKIKDKVTVLVTCNMTGIDKPDLLLIGISMRPRCFPRDLTQLPVCYAPSSNASMTEQIFTRHLSAWNSMLRFQKRNIALLLDNCSSHPADLQLSNIKLFFLPPNTSSTLQPLDMGVIKNLKCHYRAELNKRIVATLDADPTKTAQDALKSVQLIDTVYMLKDAWRKVTSETISKCFNHAGWKSHEEPRAADLPAFPAPDNMTEEEWRAFLDVDNDLDTVGGLADSEITHVIQKRRIDPEVGNADENKSDDEDDETKPITRLHVNEALQTLRTYLQMNGLEDARLQLQEIEAEISSDFKSRQTQISMNCLKPDTPSL